MSMENLPALGPQFIYLIWYHLNLSNYLAEEESRQNVYIALYKSQYNYVNNFFKKVSVIYCIVFQINHAKEIPIFCL